MNFRYILITFFYLLLIVSVPTADSQTPPAHAITNSTIHHANGSVTGSGSIVWRNGIIESIGPADSIEVPFDAFTMDGGDSLHIYPGLTDGFAFWGSPDTPDEHERPEIPGNPGYERAGIQPDRLTSNVLQNKDETINRALKGGYTTAMIGIKGYMLPGRAGIFFLNEEDTKSGLYRENAALHFQFQPAPGGWGNRAYPTTTMGVMARFRQLLYDAEALQQHLNDYAESEPGMPVPERDEVLEALFSILNRDQKVYVSANTKEDIERFLILADEFDLDAVIVSGREASQIANELFVREIPVLASFDFPDAPDWYTEGETASAEGLDPEEQSYRERQLEAWFAQVRNIRALLDAGVRVGFASHGLALDDIQQKTRLLLQEGEITTEELLTLMTVSTASILGISSHTGTLSRGMVANFSVWTNPTDDKEASVLKTIANGTIHEF